MRYSIIALLAALSAPVSAQIEGGSVGFPPNQGGHEPDVDSGTLARESPTLLPPMLNAVGHDPDVDGNATILQGLVYVPNETLTLFLGTGPAATLVDADIPAAHDNGPVLSLQSRVRFSRELGLLLGIDHMELDGDAADVYRADLLMRREASPVSFVLSYEISDGADSDDDGHAYGLGLHCNF